MQKVQGIATRGGVEIVTSGVDSTTEAVESFPGCTVSVYNVGTVTLATISSDAAGTPKANPFTASSSDASYYFYANPGSYDIQFSGTGITVPFSLTDVSVGSGSTYNVGSYGIYGVAHGSTPTDESTAFLALLTTVYNAGGGTIEFNNRAYRFDSSWVIPNNAASPPTQPSLRITGQGPSHNGQGGAPNGGTIIDLRYNSTNSKIDTRGLGFLEIDHISFKDGGAASAVPFLQTTSTTLSVHDCEFYGNTANTPTQDAIVLGGTAIGAATTAFNSPFQGYGALINNNYFNRIQRGVYGRTYCNNVQISNNTWWTQCGGTAAVEFLADVTNSNTGNYIRGNLIEVGNYVYGMKFGGPFNLNNLGPNGFFDPTGTTTAYYRFETAAAFNMVIDGYRDDAVGTLISETGGSVGTTAVLTIHQSQRSKWPQPWDFLNEVKSIRDNAGTWLIQNTAGDKVQQSLSVGGTRWSFGQIPNGGSLRPQFTVEAVSATRVDFEMDGSSDNRIFSTGSADLRLQGAGTLWLGTPSVQDVVLINGTTITASKQIISSVTTGTAPFSVASTTNVPNLNASSLGGATFAAPGPVGSGTPSTGAFTTLLGSTSLTVGAGTAITKILKGSVTIDPASVNATTVSSQTFTLTGAATGDSLRLNPPTAGLTAGMLVCQAFVSAADTITVVFYNTTGAPIDLGSASWTYSLIR